MNKFLNMQMIMFGDYTGINPQTDIIIKLLNELKEDGFIPGSIDVPTIDLKTGRMTIDNRIQMISPDRTWSIVFLNDRISCNYSLQNNTKVFSSIIDLVKISQNYIKKVVAVFPDVQGNRLALNCQTALENMTLDDMKQFSDRFTTSFDVFDDNDYAEWSVRYNARGDILIDATKYEKCNRIVEMSQIERLDISKSPTETVHGIIINIDINTLTTNISTRFTLNSLISFSNEVISFVDKFINEIINEG